MPVIKKILKARNKTEFFFLMTKTILESWEKPIEHKKNSGPALHYYVLKKIYGSSPSQCIIINFVVQQKKEQAKQHCFNFLPEVPLQLFRTFEHKKSAKKVMSSILSSYTNRQSIKSKTRSQHPICELSYPPAFAKKFQCWRYV